MAKSTVIEMLENEATTASIAKHLKVSIDEAAKLIQVAILNKGKS